MTYKYKWVITNYVNKLKKNIIPLKADKLLFTNNFKIK